MEGDRCVGSEARGAIDGSMEGKYLIPGRMESGVCILDY